MTSNTEIDNTEIDMTCSKNYCYLIIRIILLKVFRFKRDTTTELSPVNYDTKLKHSL